MITTTRILLAACLAFTPFAAVGFGPIAIVPRNTAAVTSTRLAAAVLDKPSTASSTKRRKGGSSLVDKDYTNIKISKQQRPYSKEIPKVLGGVKIGLKKLVVITGASSGLGRSATIALAKTGKYHVVMACRDVDKAKRGT